MDDGRELEGHWVDDPWPGPYEADIHWSDGASNPLADLKDMFARMGDLTTRSASDLIDSFGYAFRAKRNSDHVSTHMFGLAPPSLPEHKNHIHLEVGGYIRPLPQKPVNTGPRSGSTFDRLGRRKH